MYRGAFRESYPLFRKLSRVSDDYDFAYAKKWQLINEFMDYIAQKAPDDAR